MKNENLLVQNDTNGGTFKRVRVRGKTLTAIQGHEAKVTGRSLNRRAMRMCLDLDGPSHVLHNTIYIRLLGSQNASESRPSVIIACIYYH